MPLVPNTWTALLVLALAVLPGAMFTFGFERQAGAFGVTLADRVLRFVAMSLFFDLGFALPAYLTHRLGWWPPPWHGGQFAMAWVGAAALLVVPTVTGSAIGGLYASRVTRTGWPLLRGLVGEQREARLLQFALGRDPAPRAWDHHFSERPNEYLRVRTANGQWLGGAFAADSYSGGFPHDTDLLIEEAWPIDEAGRFGDAPLGYAVYVPAATIAYIEIVDPWKSREARHG